MSFWTKSVVAIYGRHLSNGDLMFSSRSLFAVTICKWRPLTQHTKSFFVAICLRATFHGDPTPEWFLRKNHSVAMATPLNGDTHKVRQCPVFHFVHNVQVCKVVNPKEKPRAFSEGGSRVKPSTPMCMRTFSNIFRKRITRHKHITRYNQQGASV